MSESNLDKELLESEKNLLVTDALLRHQLIQRGDSLAKKHGYPELRGIDALCRYFADKYHWLPEQTRNLSTGDLSLLLEGAK